MNHEILRKAVEKACSKIAESGTEGVEDKDVTLACFGMLMFNGIESLRKTISKAAWIVVSCTVSAVIAILLAVLLG